MRRSSNKLSPSLKNQLIRTFAQNIADLGELDDVYIFLRDFFTEAELEIFAKRLAIAYWLKKGRSYTNIKNNLKVSSATIASMASKADTAGISLSMKKFEAEEWASIWERKIKKFLG